MVSKKQIARINALYKKQKSEGLSEEEKKEQAYLRRLYIDSMKANLKSQLDSIKIVKPSNCCDHHNDKEFDMFPAHCIAQTAGARIIEDLDVKDENKIIKKRRYSAFFGTDLDLYLREKGVDELFLVGVCTNICVLYTAADARNLAYKVNIYKDGVASFDEKAHEFALKEAKNTLGCRLI